MPASPLHDGTGKPRSGTLALATVLLSFVALGFFGAMAGAMVPAVQSMFGIGLSVAIVVQWIGMIGCGLSSLPLARALATLGPGRLMIAGLAASLLGCLAVGAAMQVGAMAGYACLLAALLLLSTGATALQVAINPLALDLGAPATGAARLTLAQGLNSLGVLAGINLATYTVFGHAGAIPEPARLAHGLAQAYVTGAAVLAGVLLLAALAWPALSRATLASDAATPTHGSALGCRRAVAGAAAIALYVGAEGAIGGIMAGYLHQPHILGVPLATAARYLADFYWGGAMLGRFAGAGILRRWPAPRVLLVAATLATLGCGIAALASGPVAAIAALGIGLCNSVMFPLIFSITLARTRASAAATSGLLVLATAGGALVSVAVGVVGEHIGLSAAFAVPLCAYLAIAVFSRNAA